MPRGRGSTRHENCVLLGASRDGRTPKCSWCGKPDAKIGEALLHAPHSARSVGSDACVETRGSEYFKAGERFRHGTYQKPAMKVAHECCAGLDVHKRTVVACVLKGAPGQEPAPETRSFGTTTPELMEMVEWLKGHRTTHIAMEATGNYWMPVHNLLEGHFELVVTNAAHMKAVNLPRFSGQAGRSHWIKDNDHATNPTELSGGLPPGSRQPSTQQWPSA